MQQAWHIFKKDVLFLRLETSNYLAAILVAWWLASYSIRVAEILIAFTGAYLIAGLIHADAPAGDRQFWVTRPYRWQSLLAAKLLFILVLIDLPVLLAQLALLTHNQFTLSAIWRGLLWEQFLLFFGVFLPMAALAALTAGLVSFFSFAMGAILIDMGVTFLANTQQHSLRSAEWVRSSLYLIIVLAASAVVVWLQYKRRNTDRARLIALGIVLPCVIIAIFVPWPMAFAVQQSLLSQSFNPSSLIVTLTPSTSVEMGLAPLRGKGVELSFALALTGLPADDAISPEYLDLTVRAPDGRDTHLNLPDLDLPDNVPPRSGGLLLNHTCDLDRAFFNAERDRPVTLTGSLYLTVFGNKSEHTVHRHWPQEPVDVTSRLRCFVGAFGVMCSSPFRSPDAWVTVEGASYSRMSLYYRHSHSPFPAELGFYPFDHQFAPPPVRRHEARERPGVTAAPGWDGVAIPVPELTVEIAEPVAYIRRDFEIHDVHLTDIAIPWHIERVSRDGKTFLEKEY